MKRLILFELMILFLATTFESDSPPGWYQQVLPRTDVLLSDIYFLDTANGWAVGQKYPSNDTAFVYRTINSGTNWNEQYRLSANFSTIQFLDVNTGYIAGGDGFGRLFKTTNTGTNWNLVSTLGFYLADLFFISKDTGWVCDPDATFGAGLQKTTNGGINWFQQLPRAYKPMKLFFINKDTGWAACNFSGVGTGRELYRTTNGGTNWNIQFTFTQQIMDIHFFNKTIGIISSGINQRTTDAGFSWNQTNESGSKLSFANDSVGWAGNNFFTVTKTTNGGKYWFNQTSPIFNALSTSVKDTNKAWAGGNGVIHTTDGGGPPVAIEPIGNEIPTEYKLFQNYPNPFNAMTKLKFQISKQGYVQIKLFDVTGKQVLIIANAEMKSGVYETLVDAGNFSTGIYFYSLIIDGKLIETKKMILIK